MTQPAVGDRHPQELGVVDGSGGEILNMPPEFGRRVLDQNRQTATEYEELRGPVRSATTTTPSWPFPLNGRFGPHWPGILAFKDPPKPS
jgi:hypothetical protein